MTRSYRDHVADILICFLETQEFNEIEKFLNRDMGHASRSRPS